MIEFIFTLDYEIYGDGTGALADLVFEPAARLKELFDRRKLRFVNFVEVAEFEKIEEQGSDLSIDRVKEQIREMHRDGYEIALHLHPQWCNARYENGGWLLDLSEYNLCKLPEARISSIVSRSLDYLRDALAAPGFTPISFRAGNWLFQPTQVAAGVLREHGIWIDSSVFKGGLQHNHGLDYRPALRNGQYWTFHADVNQPDPEGVMMEVPIHAEMVPFWRMATSKRSSYSNQFGVSRASRRKKLMRLRDFARLRYPLKLDFCRMTLAELTSMVERVAEEDRSDAERYRPLVAIGHTKDRPDCAMLDSFLDFLESQGIPVATFETAAPKLAQSTGRAAPLRDASRKFSREPESRQAVMGHAGNP